MNYDQRRWKADIDRYHYIKEQMVKAPPFIVEHFRPNWEKELDDIEARYPQHKHAFR